MSSSVVHRRVELHGHDALPALELLPEEIAFGLRALRLRRALRHRNAHGRVRLERRLQCRDVLRRRAAAAAEDQRARQCRRLLHLLGEILRRAVIDRLAADDRRVAGVRHHDHRRAVGAQGAQELHQMVRAGAAVEAGDVHLRHRARPVIKRLPEQTVARDPVVAHGVGHDEESLRAFLLHVRGKLRDAVGRAQRLHEKMRDPLVQKQIRLPDEALRRRSRAAVRRGADIAEDNRAEFRRRAFGEPAARAQHRFGLRRLRIGKVFAQTVGVRLERHRPRAQIRAVDLQNLRGVEDVGLLAAHLLPLRQGGKVGSHGAVK